MGEGEKKGSAISTGILVMASIAVVILAFAFGAAFTGIQSARQVAAQASLGQIESVFLLAEAKAAEAGLAPPAGSYKNLLRSYDPVAGANLSEYEKHVLDTMLDFFGPHRDFDFAVTRYYDSAGAHTSVYYFPVRGRTDTKTDLCYLSTDGNMTEIRP